MYLNYEVEVKGAEDWTQVQVRPNFDSHWQYQIPLREITFTVSKSTIAELKFLIKTPMDVRSKLLEVIQGIYNLFGLSLRETGMCPTRFETEQTQTRKETINFWELDFSKYRFDGPDGASRHLDKILGIIQERLLMAESDANEVRKAFEKFGYVPLQKEKKPEETKPKKEHRHRHHHHRQNESTNPDPQNELVYPPETLGSVSRRTSPSLSEFSVFSSDQDQQSSSGANPLQHG